MNKLMSVLTIAVLPLSLLTACQSTRHNTGAAPASDRFSSADQERIMVSQMNLNRAGDPSDLTASERDNIALRGGKTQRPRTTQATVGSTNEMASAKGFSNDNDTGRLSQQYSDQQPVAREGALVIAPEMADIGRYEPDFRQNYENNFANSGYGYDQYRPAYRYGYEMASDSRYNASDWSDIEMQARRNWNEGTLGPWERYKDAVKYGWERGRQAATGRS
jgi:hypothetical protein